MGGGLSRGTWIWFGDMMEKKLCGLKEAMREDAATHGEKVADLEEELQVQT